MITTYTQSVFRIDMMMELPIEAEFRTCAEFLPIFLVSKVSLPAADEANPGFGFLLTMIDSFSITFMVNAVAHTEDEIPMSWGDVYLGRHGDYAVQVVTLIDEDGQYHVILSLSKWDELAKIEAKAFDFLRQGWTSFEVLEHLNKGFQEILDIIAEGEL